jgi:hypothetical protein
VDDQKLASPWRSAGAPPKADGSQQFGKATVAAISSEPDPSPDKPALRALLARFKPETFHRELNRVELRSLVGALLTRRQLVHSALVMRSMAENAPQIRRNPGRPVMELLRIC